MPEENEEKESDYNKEFDNNKHLDSNDNYEDDNYDDYDDYDTCSDSDSDRIEAYNFTDYADLLSIAEIEDNPDKITNTINAMIKTTEILNCKEVSFKIDFDFGEYGVWVSKTKIFNKTVSNKNYSILIDEDVIVCIAFA